MDPVNSRFFRHDRFLSQNYICFSSKSSIYTGSRQKKQSKKKQENRYFLFICHKIIAFLAHFSYKFNRFVSKLFCFFGLLCIGQACYNEFTRQDKITKISQRTNSLTLCIPFEGVPTACRFYRHAVGGIAVPFFSGRRLSYDTPTFLFCRGGSSDPPVHIAESRGGKPVQKKYFLHREILFIPIID